MLKISIISKDKVLYQGEASSVLVPTKSGIIEVLPNHMPLVSAISIGDLVIKTEKGSQSWKISGGVLEIRSQSEIVILADKIE